MATCLERSNEFESHNKAAPLFSVHGELVHCPAEGCEVQCFRWLAVTASSAIRLGSIDFFVPDFAKAYILEPENVFTIHSLNIWKHGHVVNCWNMICIFPKVV